MLCGVIGCNSFPWGFLVIFLYISSDIVQVLKSLICMRKYEVPHFLEGGGGGGGGGVLSNIL